MKHKTAMRASEIYRAQHHHAARKGIERVKVKSGEQPVSLFVRENRRYVIAMRYSISKALPYDSRKISIPISDTTTCVTFGSMAAARGCCRIAIVARAPVAGGINRAGNARLDMAAANAADVVRQPNGRPTPIIM